MTEISGEVEKLKTLATNKQIYSFEREEAIRALGDIGNKEAALVLLDIANDRGLYSFERVLALSKAREILSAEKI